jgi:hypothetical protein
VAIKLGLTRERIRQILVKGNEYGLIDYQASAIRRFDELSNKIQKRELENLIMTSGLLEVKRGCL